MATKKSVTSFLAGCIALSETDGYQHLEGLDGEVPEGATPDEWGTRDDRTLWLRFGTDVFDVTISKPRKEPEQ